jgi:hypothetical protein
MTVRPFDWRDLASLHHYRNQTVFLDSALVLTRGPLLVPGALFSFLVPGLGIFTAVGKTNEADQVTVIGQIIHLPGTPFAHLTFVTPEEYLHIPVLQELLEYLIAIAGGRGAFRLLADVDDCTMTYEVLRRASFAIYARQRIWQLTQKFIAREHKPVWRPAKNGDALAIRLLYNNLVPGLVQQIEPFGSNQRPKGMVCQENDDLLAYVEVRYGQRGIWMQPFFHPDAQNVTERLFELLQSMTGRGNRPVYICVRSYQSWLEPAIEELGAEAGPRQAVMVKQLTGSQKVLRQLAVPALEGGQPEITAPIMHLEKHSNQEGIKYY